MRFTCYFVRFMDSLVRIRVLELSRESSRELNQTNNLLTKGKLIHKSYS